MQENQEMDPKDLEIRRLQAENKSINNAMHAMAAGRGKPWYRQWKRLGGLLAVLLPIVNKIIGSPLDPGIVYLIVAAIIAWCGIESYKDQKIKVAQTLADANINVKKIEAATAPMFQNLMDRMRGAGGLQGGPKPGPGGLKPPAPPK